MKSARLWTVTLAAFVSLSILFIACQQPKETGPNAPATGGQESLTMRQATTAQIEGTSPHGSGELMPAYYDGKLFTINFMELPPAGEKAALASNRSINLIYMSDNGLPGNAPFISVLDAIQGDGFNPLWIEVQITFKEGFTPRQLTSDTEIEAAASGDNPEIMLTFTDEVYRCSVIGRK